MKLLHTWFPLFVLVLSLGDFRSAAQEKNQPVVGLEFSPLIDHLKEVIQDPRLRGARVGIRVDNVESGQTLFAHNPEALINPASVTKIFTTAAALCLLHPNYRFKTELYVSQPPEKGVIRGPLYIKGYGDPYLVNERLTFLAIELKALGIQKIEGPLIVDDSYFDSEREGPGWSQDPTSRPYQAPIGALSLNFNAVAVNVLPSEQLGQPAQIELFPNSDHFQLINKTQTVNGSTYLRFDSDGLGRKTRVTVRGQISLHFPPYRNYTRIIFPALYTGHSLLQALDQSGIKTRPQVQTGRVPGSADLLYTLQSPALGELVRKVNKLSQNFMAEQLFKTMGAEFLGTPGSWWKGEQVMQAFLEEEVDIPSGTHIIQNGSGLNDVNRISASQVVTLLRYMWSRFDVRSDFVASLSESGSDGTLVGRFVHPTLTRTMRLKTGSLENVRALAGYVNSRGNEVFSIAVLISDYSCPGSDVVRLIDRFASTLARADSNHQVIEEIEVLPIERFQEGDLIAPLGPQEGTEEAEIPIGEIPLPSKDPSLDSPK